MAINKSKAKSVSILSVAESLGIELKKSSHNIYEWTEHDSFKIFEDSNTFRWFSKDTGGDTIQLVQLIKNVSFKEAVKFIETKQLPVVEISDKPKEPFEYYLKPYETDDFEQARQYLIQNRQLSNNTIDWFLNQNVLVQAVKKDQTGYAEPIIIFKSLDHQNNIVGGSLQGLIENTEKYNRGRLKQIMRNSDGLTGMNVDIGKPNRLIFFESPIDLMSYYELNQNKLDHVRLVAMDGLKEGTISRHLFELIAELKGEENYKFDLAKSSQLLNILSKSTFFEVDQNKKMITLAIDNDHAGQVFMDKMKAKGIKFLSDMPPLINQKEKMDWNDYLIQSKIANAPQLKTNLNSSEVGFFIENKIREEAEDEGFVIGNIEQVKLPIYLFPDGSMLDGMTRWSQEEMIATNSKAIRDIDHNVLSSYLPESLSIENQGTRLPTIDKLGLIQLVPETEIAILPSEAITKEQIDVLEKLNYSKLIQSWNDQEISLQDLSIRKLNKEKAPELNQEPNIGSGTFNRTSSSLDNQVVKEAPQPVEQAQPTFSTNAQLQFSIGDGVKSIRKPSYTKANPKDLRKLNRFASVIQETAKWYNDNLSDSKISYFYKDGTDIKNLEVTFKKENFVHLTGIFPIKENQSSAQTLIDFVQGKGTYDNILVSKGYSDKLQVLPVLPEIVESTSFVFDDLSDVEKFGRLNTNKAIRSEDKDIVLALRTVDNETFPASLLKPRTTINLNLDHSNHEKEILGVFRERQGNIEKLSVNEKYIKDDGKTLKTILENHVLEAVPINKNIETSENREIENDNRTLSEILDDKDTKALSQHLRAGMVNYLNSEQYQIFLKAMSHFHAYSPNNIQLMIAQNPNITKVASLSNWNKNFERKINKGAKSLKIWTPYKTKARDNDGKIILDDEGKEVAITRFKLGSVFDVSQTNGKEIPKAINELTENVEDYQNLFRALRETALEKNIEIEFQELDSAKGYFSPNENKIVVQKNMSPAQTIKTILHELTHSRLHQNGSYDKDSTEYQKQELQAESVAYIVSDHYGIDSSSYSFGYLASWSRDADGLKAFEKQLSTIQSEASKMTDIIDSKLEKFKDQTITYDPLLKKINDIKETKVASEGKDDRLKKSRGL